MKYEKNEKNNLLRDGEEIGFILGDGEEILWQGKPNKRAYVTNKALAMMPVALLWLLFDCAFVGLVFKFALPIGAKIAVCAFVCVHLIPFWLWLSNVLTASKRHKKTDYALTTHRILIKSGLIGLEVQSVSYKDVQTVDLKIGVVDKMLKVGDLYFSTRDGRRRVAFFDIEAPYEVYKIAQKTVTDIQTDIEFPNAYRPERNPGYHTKKD